MKSNEEYIEMILKFIYEIPDQHCYLSDLPIIDGFYLSDYESERYADKLVSKGLIELDNDRVDITDFGREVYEIGGWIEYKKIEFEAARAKENYAKFKNDMEMDLVKLQTESLMYRRRNRKLEIQRYWIGIGATILGGVLGSVFL